MTHPVTCRCPSWVRWSSVVLLAVVGFGVSTALAGTISGTAVTVSGLDNLAATIESYAKGNLGKFLGILLGIAGMAAIAAGRPGVGAGAAASGVGMAFLPSIMGTAFDATAAAPLLGALPSPPLLTAWWAPLLGSLYPLALSVKFALDPVVLACQVLVVLAGWQRWRHD